MKGIIQSENEVILALPDNQADKLIGIGSLGTGKRREECAFFDDYLHAAGL
jgi:hypothetical protein